MENNNEVDKVVLRDLFNAIRNAEIKNVKIVANLPYYISTPIIM